MEKYVNISFPDPEFSGLLHFCHIFCSSGLSLFIVGPFMCRRACAQFLFPSLDSQGQCTAHMKQIKSGFIWLPQRWQMVMVGKANVQIYYNTYISWFLYSVFYSVFWNADLYIKELKLCFFFWKNILSLGILFHEGYTFCFIYTICHVFFCLKMF